MPVGTRAHCNPRRSLIVDVEMLITSNEGHLTDETPAYLERQRTKYGDLDVSGQLK